MNDAQARAFEATVIPFGKYQGCKVEDVTLDYLVNLADPSEFIRDVRRYLAKPRIFGELKDATE